MVVYNLLIEILRFKEKKKKGRLWGIIVKFTSNSPLVTRSVLWLNSEHLHVWRKHPCGHGGTVKTWPWKHSFCTCSPSQKRCRLITNHDLYSYSPLCFPRHLHSHVVHKCVCSPCLPKQCSPVSMHGSMPIHLHFGKGRTEFEKWPALCSLERSDS